MHGLQYRQLDMFLNFFKTSTLCVLSGLMLSCQSDREVAASNPDISDIPDQEGWNSTIVSTHKGKLSSKIKYVHMKIFSKKKLVKFVDGVEFEFFDENEDQTSRIQADEAVLNENTKNIDLTGHVVVTTSDGIQLNTSSLRLTQNQSKIRSEDFVRFVTADNDTIFGHGFTSEKSLKNWTIKNPTGVTQKKLQLDFKDDKDTN